MPKIISIITKHAIASTLVILLAVGTLGVTAAEAFAPSSNKPSSLLGFNKSKSSGSSDISSTANLSSTSYLSSSAAQTINNQDVDTGSSWTGKITLRFAVDKTCKTDIVDQYDPTIGDFLNEYISSYCENPNSSGTITNRNSKGFKQEIYASVRNSLKENDSPLRGAPVGIKPQGKALDPKQVSDPDASAEVFSTNKATKSLEKRTEILKILNIYDFDFKAAQIASKLKSDLEQKGLLIDNFDLIIASICLTNNLILVTNNTKHFQNIPNLKLEDWTL